MSELEFDVKTKTKNLRRRLRRHLTRWPESGRTSFIHILRQVADEIESEEPDCMESQP